MTDPIVDPATQVVDCSDEFNATDNTEKRTEFDEGAGFVLLVGAKDCNKKQQKELEKENKKAKKEAEKWDKKQKKIAEENGTTYEKKPPSPSDADSSFSEETLEDIREYELYGDQVGTYTDGYTLQAKWTWDPLEVEANDSAGLCVVDEKEENYASCWLLVRNADNTDWSSRHSYLLDPSLLTEDLILEDQVDYEVSLDMYPGYMGSWEFDNDSSASEDSHGTDSNDEVDTHIKVKTTLKSGFKNRRYLPTEANSKKEDFRFVPGNVNVYTYLSYRRRNPDPAPPANPVDDPIQAIVQERMLQNTVTGALQLFEVSLQGAIPSVVATSFAVGVSMLYGF